MAAFCRGCKAIVHWPISPSGDALPPVDHFSSPEGTVLVERDAHGVLRGEVPTGQALAALPDGTKLHPIHRCDPAKVKTPKQRRATR